MEVPTELQKKFQDQIQHMHEKFVQEKMSDSERPFRTSFEEIE